jgi:hypothetical protein
MSTVAALAVASPFAVIAVSQLTAPPRPAPEQRQFVQADMITDLPGEVISALQQGLSQFGIVVPNMPGSSTPSPALTTPGGLTTPGLTTPGPGLTTSGLTTPGLTDPPLTNPALTNPGLSNPGLSNPALTTPAGFMPPPDSANPALFSPTSLTPAAGAYPGGMPLGTPTGDPGLGATYPLLGGDPSLAAAPSGSGGLMSDLSQAANQLGLTQGIDLLKGVLMPSIMQAIKAGAPAGAPIPAPSPPMADG